MSTEATLTLKVCRCYIDLHDLPVQAIDNSVTYRRKYY